MFKHLAVAGTFDHLHSGHRQLLQTALNQGQHISLGLCRGSLLKRKPFPASLQTYSQRYRRLQTLLHHPSTTIFPLDDIYGHSPTTPHLQAIVCTTQTLNNVRKINKLRRQNHLPSVTPVLVNLVKSTDRQTLSSTRIRAGQVNRQGLAYHHWFTHHQKLILPSHHRHLLKKPFSTLLTGSQTNLNQAGQKLKKLITKHQPTYLAAVGDIAVQTLIQQHIPCPLAVIDALTKRQPYPHIKNQLTISHSAHNPPSTITLDLVNQLQSCLNQPSASLFVAGEEDLAVLPLILLSPLKSAIIYGQPNQGLVYIKVTETNKAKALNLLNKFT